MSCAKININFSVRFPMNEVHLKWQMRSPVEMQFNLDLNYFKITDLIVFSEIEKRPTGNYCCCHCSSY